MIVIKGAMPKGCEVNDENHKMKSCPLKNSCEAYLKRYQVDRDIIDYYPEGCPIVGEIPDVHGDLIERSHILDKVKDEWRKIREEKGYDVMSDFWLALCKVIEEAPTVLEASK